LLRFSSRFSPFGVRFNLYKSILDYFHKAFLWQQKYPKIQILTVEALLGGSQIQMPPSGYGTFKQAPKAKKEEGKQGDLGI
jgi:hypothetical protein